MEILVLLFENPSNDSIKLGIEVLKQCGKKLSEVSPRGLNSVFSTLRNLLHESSLDQRTQSMIEIIFGVRKDQFQAYPSIPTGLDLVYEKDQYTHLIILYGLWEEESMLGMNRLSINLIEIYLFLDVFQYDEQYEKNERKHNKIRKIILDKFDDDENESDSYSTNIDEDNDEVDTGKGK